MFTGIVDHCGIIKQIDVRDDVWRVTIASQFNQLVNGESIAIDGICLTVTKQQNKGQFCCDVSSETLAITTAQSWQTMRRVNLERALQLGDRLGGHYLLGHVDTRYQLIEKQQHDTCYLYRFTGITEQQRSFLITKGSVAINGVSLTINQVAKTDFTVMLIPHTLERTNLNDLMIDDWVNIEFDYMAKVIVNHLGVTHV